MSEAVVGNVEIKFDTHALSQKIKDNIAKCQAALDIQVQNDCNYYCPEWSGTLKKLATIHSVPGDHGIIWDTPYAYEQYYFHPNKSHDHNKNACMKWCEVAKAKYGKSWEKLVHDEYSKNDK